MARGADFYLQDHNVSADVGRLALRAGLVSVMSGYGNAALQIIAAVVLARLLTPDDFGVVAIVTALTTFAPFLIDFGLTDATVQKAKITQQQASAVFWISCALGLAIAATLAGCSPLIASVYHEPRLRSVAMWSAATFVLSGVSGQHLSLLRRTLQFTTIAKIQFLGTLVGLTVALLLAINGAGYWALVFRPIANAAFVTVGAWWACSWRPGFPVFDREVKSMVGFGMHVVGFSVVYSISRAADRIALGLHYSPKIVGYYQNAVTLYDNSIFSAFSQLHNVGSAALSKLQSSPAALIQKYETALSTLAFFAMPAAATLSITARDVVVIVLGEKWRPAGALLAIFALRGIFQAIEGSQGWLHLALGRPDRWKNWGVINAVVQITAIACGLPFGATGVAVAMVVSSALVACPSISYAGRPVGIGTALVVRATGRQFIGAVLCTAAGWLMQVTSLQHVSSITRILVAASLSNVLYLFIVVGLLRLTAPLELVARLVHQQLPPRARRWISSLRTRGCEQSRGR